MRFLTMSNATFALCIACAAVATWLEGADKAYWWAMSAWWLAASAHEKADR